MRERNKGGDVRKTESEREVKDGAKLRTASNRKEQMNRLS